MDRSAGLKVVTDVDDRLPLGAEGREHLACILGRGFWLDQRHLATREVEVLDVDDQQRGRRLGRKHRHRQRDAQRQNDCYLHVASYCGFGRPSMTAIERSMTSGGSG
jgi:hypothetical protein